MENGPFPWASAPDLVAPTPTEPSPGKWPNSIFILLLSAVVWLFQNAGGIVPPSTEPPGQPPVVVDPGVPVAPPVVLDEVGKLIRDVAAGLPSQCRPEFAAIAGNYREAAKLIDGNFIRTDVEAGVWMRIANRSKMKDESAWVEFMRSQQKIWTDQQKAGKLLLLSDWAVMLRSTADGILAAEGIRPEPGPTPAGGDA